MKQVRKKHFSVITIIVICITAIACSTTGIQRSEDVQSNMQTVDDDIKSIVVQIDAIDASLTELTRPGQADVKQAFNLFTGNLSKLESIEKNYLTHSKQMNESGEIYFSEWDKDQSYENPEIQRLSENRRRSLGETYDKIKRDQVGVDEAFRTYVSDVTQVQAYISNDLTSMGISSISTLSDQTVSNGNQLKDKLIALQTSIEGARSEMLQSGR